MHHCLTLSININSLLRPLLVSTFETCPLPPNLRHCTGSSLSSKPVITFVSTVLFQTLTRSQRMGARLVGGRGGGGGRRGRGGGRTWRGGGWRRSWRRTPCSRTSSPPLPTLVRSTCWRMGFLVTGFLLGLLSFYKEIIQLDSLFTVPILVSYSGAEGKKFFTKAKG